MISTKFLLFALACLVALASASPSPRAAHTRIVKIRRSTCPKKTTFIYPSSTADAGVPSIPAVIPTPVVPSPTASSTRVVVPSSEEPVPTPSQDPSPPASSPPAPSSSSAQPPAPSSSSAAPPPPPPPSSSAPPPPASTGVIGGLLGQLFPVQGYGNRAWSTSGALGSASSLSDATFRPQNVLRSVVHSYTNAPDGKPAMRAFYPQGSYTFGFKPQGGFSFYAPGPANVDLSNAKEATFGYAVYFPSGFGFQLGGKLPGLYGGNSASEAVGCSGGSRSNACFSARLMWRENGEGEFYTYLPPALGSNQKVCSLPNSHCNPTYGASVGRGSFRFATGAWTYITERVRLNDAGRANGQLQLFVNGKSVLDIDGLELRNSESGKIRGMQMQTFFGGSKPEFASPKDQEVFSDFSVAITQTF